MRPTYIFADNIIASRSLLRSSSESGPYCHSRMFVWMSFASRSQRVSLIVVPGCLFVCRDVCLSAPADGAAAAAQQLLRSCCAAAAAQQQAAA